MSKFPYPNNEIPSALPLNNAIKKRWSPLAFSDEVIEQEKIDSLFEAMRYAQSSRNEQPWRVVYATKDDKEGFDKLVSLLTEDNYSYAKDAYLLMLICAWPTHEYKDRPNRTHQYDTGAATQSLILQAVDLGLITHPMGGFDKERPYTELGIPEGTPLMIMLAIGYPGDESKVDPEVLKKRYADHLVRKEVGEFAFKNKWKS